LTEHPLPAFISDYSFSARIMNLCKGYSDGRVRLGSDRHRTVQSIHLPED